MIYADLNFMEEKETTGRGRQSQVARGLEGGADAGLATRGAGGTGTGTGTGMGTGTGSAARTNTAALQPGCREGGVCGPPLPR